MNELIKIERDGPVAILTLNNPPHNLLTTQFLSEYCEALEQAPADGARAILVKSDLRHFCAGADVEKLSEDAIDAEQILKRFLLEISNWKRCKLPPRAITAALRVLLNLRRVAFSLKMLSASSAWEWRIVSNTSAGVL